MVIKHSFQYLLSKGVPAIVNFLAIVLFSRIVSPTEYGQYALIIAGVTLFNSLCFQWIRLSLLRYYDANSDTKQIELSNLIVAYVLIVSLIILLSLLYLTIPKSTSVVTISLGVALLACQAWYELNLELIRTELNPIHFGIISFLKSSIFLIGGAIFVNVGYGYHGLIFALILSYLLPTITNLKKWKYVSLRYVDKKVLKKFVYYGIPLTASSSLMFIINYSDRFFIEYFLDTSSVGLYSISYDFVQSTIITLMMVVNLAVYPLAVKIYDNYGKRRTAVFLKKSLKLLSLICTPLIIVFITYPELVSGIVFGEKYSSTASYLLPILSIAIFIKGIKVYYFDYSFHLSENTKYQFYISMYIAIINIVLNYYLIPVYQVNGAVYSTLLSFAIGVLLSYYYGNKYINLAISKDNIKTIAIVIIVSIIISLFNSVISGYLGLLLILFSSYSLYVILLYLLGDTYIKSMISLYVIRKLFNN